MIITLKDGSKKEYSEAKSVIDIAYDISEGLARAACAGEVNGEVVDLRTVLDSDCELNILTAKDEKGLADLRRAGEEVSPRRQQSFNDRGTKRKARFHQLRHGHGLNFPKPLVRFFNVCYTVCACKRGRLLPIWCNRWIWGSRFFILPHGHLRCSARSIQ